MISKILISTQLFHKQSKGSLLVIKFIYDQWQIRLLFLFHVSVYLMSLLYSYWPNSLQFMIHKITTKTKSEIQSFQRHLSTPPCIFDDFSINFTAPLYAQNPSKPTTLQTGASENKSDEQPAPAPTAKPIRKRIGPFQFCLSDVIGRGFSSKVYKGSRQKDNLTVAIKVIALANLTSERKLLLENQVALLRTLSHPHIVALVDVYYTVNNCYIITEFCEGGSLQAKIDDHEGIQWQKIAQQMGAAVQYLANQGIIHRDIKPANVLVAGGSYKLCDFGFALKLNRSDQTISEKFLIGSPIYMPPQALADRFYSLKGDAFAFGVFLYYIATKHFPWRGKNKEELIRHYFQKGASQRKIILLPPKIKHFINGLLQRNAQNRLNICQIDFNAFSRAQFSLSVEPQLLRLKGRYHLQMKLCQFIHFLMVNFHEWRHFNLFLLEMMAKHLTQLVQIFEWNKQALMVKLIAQFRLHRGEFLFTTDHYHWLNNCLKDTIATIYSAINDGCAVGLLYKLMQYQIMIESILYNGIESIIPMLEELTLHQSFHLIKVAPQQLNRLYSNIDFYQL